MTLSITITLTGDDLTIGSTPGIGYLWIDEKGNQLPSFALRYRAATDSDVHPGRTLLAYTTDQDELQFTVYAQAATQAALDTLKATLTAALMTTGTITVTENGVATAYTDRWPARPRWNELDSGMSRAFLARASCVVPVNPT